MTSKDTVDILNRKEFFYYDKPTKTPEIEKQDREQTKRDFELIRKDLEILEILKSHAKLTELNSVYMGYPKTIVIAIEPNDDDYEIVKRWLNNDK